MLFNTGEADADAKRFYRMALRDMPAKLRQAYWRDVICTDSYTTTAADWTDPDDCDGLCDVRDCLPFGLAELHAPHRTRAREQRQIARDGVDAVNVQCVLGEPHEFSFGDEQVLLNPGDLCIVAMDWPHTMRAQNSIGLRWVEIPRAVLSPLIAGGRPRRPLVLRAESPLGGVVSSSLEAAWEQVPRLDPIVGSAVLRNLAGLVALAFGASEAGTQAAGGALMATRRRLAVAFVQQNLADPALSPAQTAAALGISVRTLHALFAADQDGFSRFVARQRLSASRALLEDPTHRHRSIADIAYGTGFNSLATFYRSFQAAFGVSPGESRSNGRRC